jgi:hypothetical protein
VKNEEVKSEEFVTGRTLSNSSRSSRSPLIT